MGLLDFLSGKPKITEPAYDDIPMEHIALYQYFFEKIIDFVDVENYTKWAKGHKHDRSQHDVDDERMEKFVFKEFSNTKLSPATMQVMVHQYFFADVFKREADKKKWVYRVMHRKEIDYFPSAMAVCNALGME